MEFTCRRATGRDAAALAKLFTGTVTTVNTADYTPEEAADWASCGSGEDRWRVLVGSMYFIVATASDGRMAGFAGLHGNGYLDYLFVDKDMQGQGAGSFLLDNIERYAAASGISRIFSEVSITAKPFFQSRGYTVVKCQKRKARRLYLTNYVMEKTLG